MNNVIPFKASLACNAVPRNDISQVRTHELMNAQPLRLRELQLDQRDSELIELCEGIIKGDDVTQRARVLLGRLARRKA